MKIQNIYSVTVYDEWAKDHGEKLNQYLHRIPCKIYHEISKASDSIDYLTIVFPNFNLIKDHKNNFIQKLEKSLKKIPIIKDHSEIIPGTKVSLEKWISKNNPKSKLNFLNDFNPKEGFIGYHLKRK